MDLSTLEVIIIAACPAISAGLTTVLGFLSLVKTIKQLRSDNDQSVGKSNQRIERLEKKINTMSNKVSSIEQYLVDKKEGRL